MAANGKKDTKVDDDDNEDDDYDMFSGATPPPVTKPTASLALGGGKEGATNKGKEALKTAVVAGRVVEDAADVEGYFNSTAGMVIKSPKDSYVVKGELGKGVFSTVFLVNLASNNAEAACKVLRSNEMMRKAGEKEMAILKEIGPRKRIGINFEGVRAYASQLFSALAKLKSMRIVHADLKPDNILVSADLRRVALADFGSAFRLTDADAGQPTPYLVSRYYRAPEIMLGLTYGCEADVWALGATIFELATGSLLFTGSTNNDMLKQLQRALGPFPSAMIRKHIRSYVDKLELEPHFDAESFKFKQHDADPVTGKIVRKLVHYKEPSRLDSFTVLGRLKANKDELDADLVNLGDLILRCLTLDPAHRLDPAHVDDVSLFKKPKVA